MRILIRASEQQQQYLSAAFPEGTLVSWYQPGCNMADANAFIDLRYDSEGPVFTDGRQMPVFLCAVNATGRDLPEGIHRINAWPGFLEKKLVEIVPGAAWDQAEPILKVLGWDFVVVPDQPGMIAPRVVAMIINEAYYAWGEGVSSKADIDTAMKLGTNYPYGPFEWAGRIGLHRIAALLQVLQEDDERYTPAPALLQEAGLAS